MSHNRNSSVDTVSGILVFWMILFHVFQWAHCTAHPIYQVGLRFFFFYMAWFFFKSGMFHKDRPHLELIKHSFSTLIFPFLLWFGFSYALVSASFRLNHNWSLSQILSYPFNQVLYAGNLPGNPPLWFLVSLFLSQLIASFFIKRKIPYLAIVISLAIGGLLSTASAVFPFSLPAIPLGVSFYLYGYLLKGASSRSSSIRLDYVILTGVLLIVLFEPSFVDFRTGRLDFGNFPFYIFSAFGILLLIQHRIKGGFSPFAWIGRNSLAFFVLHWPVLIVAKYLLQRFHYELAGTALTAVFLSLCLVIPSIAVLLFSRKSISIGSFKLRWL